MTEPPDTYHHSLITGLSEVLTRTTGLDTASKSGASSSLARLIEETCRALDIPGAALLVTAGKGLRTIAKHGLDPADLACIVKSIKSSLALATDDARAGEPRWQDQGIVGPEAVFRDGESVRTAIRASVAPGESMLAVFVTVGDPSSEQVSAFRLAAAYLAGLTASAYSRTQLAASTENTQRLGKELKEMQVCSLNIMEDLQRKNRDLAMLNRLSQEMTGCTSLPELARVATEAVSGAFDGACVSIYLSDIAASAFVPYHTTGALTTDADNLNVEVGDPLLAAISRGKEITFDSTTEPALFPLARAIEAKSGLLIPLRSKEATLGFLAVCETRWHRVFTDDERDNLRALAGNLSIAMENATLLARSAHQVDEMNALTEYVETVVDSVDLAILVVGADLKIGMINKGFEKVYGMPRQGFIGRPIFEAFPHLVEQGFPEIAKQVLGGKHFSRSGWRRTTLGGKEAVQNFMIFPHRSSGGSIIGAIVIIEDVTEKAVLETQLARSEAKFQNLVEDLADGYMIVTAGRITYANKAASQMTGIPPSELRGMEVERLLPDATMLAECPRPEAKRIRRESRLIHSTGTWIPVEVNLSTCEYGGDRSLSIAMRDITERRKFEKQLERKNREMVFRNEQITRLNSELEATVNKLKESQENLIKSERLAAITETSVAANHEINNPLFSILGQAQLLLRRYGDQDEDTSARLKTIEESALRIACVTKKLANLAEPVVKDYAGLDTSMIDVDRSTTR
jgi:PAS domain S-box-containing protein